MRFVSITLVGSILAACSPAPAPEPTAAPAPPAVVETALPAPVPEPEPEPEPVMTGGYSPASLDDEMVKAAQAVAVDAIYTRDPTRALVEKVEAEMQVVAGLNYRFVVTMTGGSRFGVTVYRKLDGTMEVTDYAQL
jgi:class 3 adenylate cyclase